MSRVRPLAVFSLPPRSTTALAKRPLAMMVTLFAFFAFIARAIVGVVHSLDRWGSHSTDKTP